MKPASYVNLIANDRNSFKNEVQRPLEYQYKCVRAFEWNKFSDMPIKLYL